MRARGRHADDGGKHARGAPGLHVTERPRITLDQLRVFVAVAERQHVTRAAEALNLAQSAASAAIAALEARHQVRLFRRAGRGIALTEAGEAFLPEARAVLARAEAAEAVLDDIVGLRRGRLALHASQTIAAYWLPRHLAAFRATYPGVALRLAIGNTEQTAAAVRAGLVELGLVEGAVSDPLLDAVPLARDQLLLVVPPGHRLAAAREVTARDLRACAWVLREPGSGTRSAFEAALHRFGVVPSALSVVQELPSNESVRAAVEAGMGVAVLSASVVAPSLEAGLLARAALDLPARQFQALRLRDRRPSHAAEALLALMMPTRLKARGSASG